jgi:hypothetical protein
METHSQRSVASSYPAAGFFSDDILIAATTAPQLVFRLTDENSAPRNLSSKEKLIRMFSEQLSLLQSSNSQLEKELHSKKHPLSLNDKLEGLSKLRQKMNEEIKSLTSEIHSITSEIKYIDDEIREKDRVFLGLESKLEILNPPEIEGISVSLDFKYAGGKNIEKEIALAKRKATEENSEDYEGHFEFETEDPVVIGPEAVKQKDNFDWNIINPIEEEEKNNRFYEKRVIDYEIFDPEAIENHWGPSLENQPDSVTELNAEKRIEELKENMEEEIKAIEAKVLLMAEIQKTIADHLEQPVFVDVPEISGEDDTRRVEELKETEFSGKIEFIERVEGELQRKDEVQEKDSYEIIEEYQGKDIVLKEDNEIGLIQKNKGMNLKESFEIKCEYKEEPVVKSIEKSKKIEESLCVHENTEEKGDRLAKSMIYNVIQEKQVDIITKEITVEPTEMKIGNSQEVDGLSHSAILSEISEDSPTRVKVQEEQKVEVKPEPKKFYAKYQPKTLPKKLQVKNNENDDFFSELSK